MVPLKPHFLKLIYLTNFQYIIKISSKEKLFENKYTYIYKQIIKVHATKRFNQALHESDWVEIETCNNPSECYKLFFKNF